MTGKNRDDLQQVIALLKRSDSIFRPAVYEFSGLVMYTTNRGVKLFGALLASVIFGGAADGGG